MNNEIVLLVFVSLLMLTGSITGRLAYKKEGAGTVFLLFSAFCLLVFALSTTYLIVEHIL